jgi:hypothetical protein
VILLHGDGAVMADQGVPHSHRNISVLGWGGGWLFQELLPPAKLELEVAPDLGGRLVQALTDLLLGQLTLMEKSPDSESAQKDTGQKDSDREEGQQAFPAGKPRSAALTAHCHRFTLGATPPVFSRAGEASQRAPHE